MPLKKLSLRPGINRENTRYTNESGWYESQWIRFRQGTPETIGGVNAITGAAGAAGTAATDAITRNIYAHDEGKQLIAGSSNGVRGSYWEKPGIPVDAFATIIRGSYSLGVNSTIAATAPMVSAISTNPANPLENKYWITLDSTDWASNAVQNFIANTPYSGTNKYVRVWIIPDNVATWPDKSTPPFIYNIQSLSGIEPYNPSTPYSFLVNMATTTLASAGGALTGTAVFLFNGLALDGDPYGYTTNWSLSSFGDDLLLSDYTSGIYRSRYTASSNTWATTALVDLPGADTPPLMANLSLVSDTSRFVMCFGTTSFTGEYDPLLVRWSDQENYLVWSPSATNQAGEVRLSKGSKIVAVVQGRQEILVWTDTALFSLQYVGAPYVWTVQLVGDNISILGPKAVSYANGVAYWMGYGKFYTYNGSVQTLNCDLRKYIFNPPALTANSLATPNDYPTQVFSSTNEGYNEIWWYYNGAQTTYLNNNWLVANSYVVYNYLENTWYYGTDTATALYDVQLGGGWASQTAAGGPIKAIPLDPQATGYFDCDLYVSDAPAGLAGSDIMWRGNKTYYNPNTSTWEPLYLEPITKSITSAEFDIDDGHNFAFIWRVLPDLTFGGSYISSPLSPYIGPYTPPDAPNVKMRILPMVNSGSGSPILASIGGNALVDIESAYASSIPTYDIWGIETFTGQVYVRIRARQMSIKFYSTELGISWQLGSPRIDMRLDGKR